MVPPFISPNINYMGGVMVSVLVPECGRSWIQAPDRVKPKTIKLVFVVSPLSMLH